MNQRAKTSLLKVVGGAFFVFAVINFFSWNPGYGSRADPPRRDLERYFGWPAVFSCDWWKQDGLAEINFLAYFPIVPIGGTMDRVSGSWSVVALLANGLFMACLAGIAIVFGRWRHGEASRRGETIAVALAFLAAMIHQFSDRFSAHL